MAIYKYRAMDHGGREVYGTLEAANQADLVKALTGNGLFLVEAAPLKSRAAAAVAAAPQKPAAAAGPAPVVIPKDRFGRAIIRPIAVDEVAAFTTQLSLMVRAAYPALSALESLTSQEKNLVFRFSLSMITERLKRGEQMSRAFSKFPQIFDPIYISLLSAGEASGKVPDMLDRISAYLEFQVELRNKIRAAMVYPLVVLGLSITVILFLMLFVLPTFVEIFEQFDAPLPTATRWLLNTSTFLRVWWWTLPIFAGGAWALFKAWLKVPANRERWDLFVLDLPIIGKMVQSIVLARILRTLADLVKCNVPILVALDLTREAALHSYYRNMVDNIKERVSQGKGISSGLYESRYFPRAFSNMVAVAERTGNLPEVLKMAAETSQKQLDTSIETTFSALEPLFIGVLSVVVAGITLCILQPIMNLGSLVN